MGALTDFFSDSDTAKSPISEQLLDNLYKVESSRNPKAVNEKSGALGGYQFLPSTVEMLGKKGIKFDPMKESEARNAARTYLEMLTEQNGGDVRKALAQYGGFVKQDPTEYVNKVLAEQSSPNTLSSFFNDEEPAIQPTGAGSGRGSYAGFNPALAQQGVIGHQVGNPIQNLKSQILADQKKETPAAVASDLLKTLATGVQAPIIGAITGKIAELRSPEFGTPQGAQVAEEQFRNYLSQTMHQPETETGKNIIEYLGKIPEKITGSHMGFGLLPEAQAIAVPAAAVGKQAMAPIVPVASKLSQVAGEIKNPFRKSLNEHLVQLAEQLTPEAQPVAGSVGASAVRQNPLKGQISGEEVARGELFPNYKLSKVSQDVPEHEQNLRAEIAHELGLDEIRQGVVTGNEQTLRNEHALAKSAEQTPEGVLMNNQITKEQNALSNYAQQRIAATGASSTLANDEQRGIRINDVFYGGTHEGEEPTSLKGFFDQAKKQIYDDARAKHGDVPVKTSHIDTLFDNPQWNATLELRENSTVASGAKKLLNLAKEVGFADQNGTMHPAGSVGAFDAVRKAINSDWSQSKASTIREINQAIDRDIAAVADPKLYKLGDRIHQAEKKIYDTPGIQRLFGETDQNGIVKSTTPLEKIPTKMNNLRKDEWRHVRDTLEDLSKGVVRGAPEGLPEVPESLRQSAKAAVAEIDGALAREVYKAGGGRAGVWNQNDVRNVLNSTVGEKIHETFPPSEVLRFQLLNTAGHIMPGVHSYEGAAAQQVRLNMLNRNLGKIGATAGSGIGAYLGGPSGAAVGGYVLGKGGEKLSEQLLLNKLRKNAELTQEQMKKNAARPKILNLRSE